MRGDISQGRSLTAEAVTANDVNRGQVALLMAISSFLKSGLQEFIPPPSVQNCNHFVRVRQWETIPSMSHPNNERYCLFVYNNNNGDPPPNIIPYGLPRW